MNLFDGLRDAAFDVVTQTMGYEATWIPSDNSLPQQTGRVLFKSNSVKGNYDLNFPQNKLDGREYDPAVVRIEYQFGDFEGLKLAIDRKQDEIIVINEVSYLPTKIASLTDGKVFIVDLLPV